MPEPGGSAGSIQALARKTPGPMPARQKLLRTGSTHPHYSQSKIEVRSSGRGRHRSNAPTGAWAAHVSGLNPFELGFSCVRIRRSRVRVAYLAWVPACHLITIVRFGLGTVTWFWLAARWAEPVRTLFCGPIFMIYVGLDDYLGCHFGTR